MIPIFRNYGNGVNREFELRRQGSANALFAGKKDVGLEAVRRFSIISG
jgi:hypothetical protein